MTIQSIRGFNDILPEHSALWRLVEDTITSVLDAYGYRQIRLPLLEKTELFKRSIGEVTDIVEKEMYSFEDRNGDSLTLRPEGTAGCVRAAIQNRLINEASQRLWYNGPMFRHERPQKGRYRQFHQVGVEVFGLAGPDIDAELILMGARIWRDLGIGDVRLELNSLGSSEARAAYRARLVEYFNGHREHLDADSLRRLESNPLRILDSKNPEMQGICEAAPQLLDHLDDESREHLDGLRRRLDSAGLSYQINPRLVRGLDYYSRTVFEWVTESLGAQGTICAGGRYDALLTQLGGKAKPAIGFAIGIERLVELVREADNTSPRAEIDAYLVAVGDDDVQIYAQTLAEALRDAVPGLHLLSHCGAGSFKSQFKKADKSGATWALIVGEQERLDETIGLKPLRLQDGERGQQQGLQQSLKLDGLIDVLRSAV